MAYAAAPCKGARGPLTRIRSRPGEPITGPTTYGLADYLEQHGHRACHGRRVPADFWQACLAYARTSADRRTLAHAAQRRGLLRIAFHLYAHTADAGDPDAPGEAAQMLREARRVEEALTWLQQRVICQEHGTRLLP